MNTNTYPADATWIEAKSCPVCGGLRDGVTWTVDAAPCTCPVVEPSVFGEARRGWECPRCLGVNAPWVARCPCPALGCTYTVTG